MQTKDALIRVAPSAPRTWPPTASSTPRCASPPSCTSRAGSPSTRWSRPCSRGSGSGSAGTDLTVGPLVTAMRHAAHSREIAELAVRHRDAGVVGFDIAGSEAGQPAHPPPRRLPVRGGRELPHHHPRRRGVRPAVDLGGRAALRGRAARPRRAHRRRHRGRPDGRAVLGPPGQLRPGPAGAARDVPDLQRQHRRVRLDRRAPDRPAGPPAVPGHRQHRQPADERRVDDLGAGRPGRGVRLRLGRLRVAHRSTP